MGLDVPKYKSPAERGEVPPAPEPPRVPSWSKSLAAAGLVFAVASLCAAKIVSPLLWATGGAMTLAALLRGDQSRGDGCFVWTVALLALVLCVFAALATMAE